MNWKQPKVYAVKHKDEVTRAESRSGGIFTALSDCILSENGVVYGCVLDEIFSAIHVRTDNSEIRNQMRGSKYIQSTLGNTFQNVKQDLLDGRNVLFSGTSCQVAGLRSFLGKEYDNLLVVDIVCHGVPSPKIWGKYLRWQEEKNAKKIIGVEFRNKTEYGWRDHVETLKMSDGSSVSSRIFTKLFYSHAILRPCCYECQFKSIMHPGDITIADYWGIEKAAPEFDDNKGVSLVLVNSENGNFYFESVKDCLIWKETRMEDSMQPPLISPFPKPEIRGEFWKDVNSRHFSYVVKKYATVPFRTRIIKMIKQKVKNLVNGS